MCISRVFVPPTLKLLKMWFFWEKKKKFPSISIGPRTFFDSWALLKRQAAVNGSTRPLSHESTPDHFDGDTVSYIIKLSILYTCDLTEVTFKYNSTWSIKTWNFLLPFGSAMLATEYCHTDSFRAGSLSNNPKVWWKLDHVQKSSNNLVFHDKTSKFSMSPQLQRPTKSH